MLSSAITCKQIEPFPPHFRIENQTGVDSVKSITLLTLLLSGLTLACVPGLPSESGQESISTPSSTSAEPGLTFVTVGTPEPSNDVKSVKATLTAGDMENRFLGKTKDEPYYMTIKNCGGAVELRRAILREVVPREHTGPLPFEFFASWGDPVHWHILSPSRGGVWDVSAAGSISSECTVTITSPFPTPTSAPPTPTLESTPTPGPTSDTWENRMREAVKICGDPYQYQDSILDMLSEAQRTDLLFDSRARFNYVWIQEGEVWSGHQMTREGLGWVWNFPVSPTGGFMDYLGYFTVLDSGCSVEDKIYVDPAYKDRVFSTK